jgi:hypothetical protein
VFSTSAMWQQVLDSVPSAVAHSLRADVERLLGSAPDAASPGAALYQLAPADLAGSGADVVRGIAMPTSYFRGAVRGRRQPSRLRPHAIRIPIKQRVTMLRQRR